MGSTDRSSAAGATFLEQPVLRDGGPPVIVYGGRSAIARRDDFLRRGALDVMADRERFFATVLEVLGRSPQATGELER